MKTAEEWALPVLNAICDNECPNLIEVFKQIQLDAYKAGMTEAAEICGKDSFLLKLPEEWGFLLKKKEEILSTRDNKETI